MIKSFKIKVYGKVQRVGFRNFLKKNAVNHEITGFTRNENNGTVFIYITGEEENIEAFLSEVKVGPDRANVEFIEVEIADKIKFDGFEIRDLS